MTGQLPARVPQAPLARRHVPADPAMLARVRDGLIRWTPDGTFSGASVIDTEALRVQAAEATLREGMTRRG